MTDELAPPSPPAPALAPAPAPDPALDPASPPSSLAGPPAGRWTPWGTLEGPAAYALSFAGAGLVVVLLAFVLLRFWMTFVVTLLAALLALQLWRAARRRT